MTNTALPTNVSMRVNPFSVVCKFITYILTYYDIICHMEKKKIIIGNWKMNPLTLKEAEKLFANVAKNISTVKRTEIVVCPPFPYMEKLKKLSRKIIMGA